MVLNYAVCRFMMQLQIGRESQGENSFVRQKFVDEKLVELSDFMIHRSKPKILSLK